MYYEPYRKKPRRQRERGERRSPGGCLAALLLRLLALALVLAALAAALLYALPPTTFNVEPEGSQLSLTDGLPASRVNILLLGVDILRQGSQRSDTILIASIGYGTVKLTSVLRDTVVEIPGHGRAKLNAAYAYGGPELVMRTLNENFHLNIMHYIAVDFVSLVEIVDAAGGVDIEITDAEREQINVNVWSARRAFESLGYSRIKLGPVSGSATVRLNGMQALGYARIRKIDSDFTRTFRQRKLLNALLGKIRGNLWNPVMLYRLGRALLKSDHTRTNMSAAQLISLGEKALVAGRAEQLRLPVDGSFTDDGSSLKITDWQANIGAFQSFVYD